MAIIYSYPQGSSALQNDRLIITRVGEEGNKITTKQLTLGQIADYIVESSPVVSGTGTPNYIPIWGAGGGSLVGRPYGVARSQLSTEFVLGPRFSARWCGATHASGSARSQGSPGRNPEAASLTQCSSLTPWAKG